MAEKSHYNYRVEPQDVDFTLRATIPSLGSAILNTAGVDAHGKGFGVDALNADNHSWVLSRMAVEFDSQPTQYTDYTIATWINEYGRVLSTRNFTLTDAAGTEFGRAVTQWAMIDLKSRSALDLSWVGDAHADAIVDAPSPTDKPRKIREVNPAQTVEHKVVYSDIDFNRHVNTMRYIEMMIDMLPVELLMLARGCYCGTFAVAAGSWPRERMVGGEISGKVLGLVGFGGIARDVALRARACGMRVMAYDPFLPADAPDWEKLGVEPVTLETLLAEADAVSLHVPLTPDTRQLFDAGRLARMKPGAVLINTARGGIVEEAALADALRSGRLAGAMVDVFEKEPLPAGSPLADVPNCLLTPHIAGVTRESNVRVSAVVARKVAECLRGAA